MTQPEHDPFGFIGLTYDDVLLLPGHTDVIPSEADTSSRISKRITVQTPAAVRRHGHRHRVADGDRHGPPGRPRRRPPQPLHRRPGRPGGPGQAQRVRHDHQPADHRPRRPRWPNWTNSARTTGSPACRWWTRACGCWASSPTATPASCRDADFPIRLVSDVMTKMPLVTGHVGISREEASHKLATNKIEKLPLVDDAGPAQGPHHHQGLHQGRAVPAGHQGRRGPAARRRGHRLLRRRLGAGHGPDRRRRGRALRRHRQRPLARACWT